MERIRIKPTDRVVVFTGAGMSADLATNEYVAIVRQRAAACPNVDDTGAPVVKCCSCTRVAGVLRRYSYN
jgi:hypothetical protein